MIRFVPSDKYPVSGFKSGDSIKSVTKFPEHCFSMNERNFWSRNPINYHIPKRVAEQKGLPKTYRECFFCGMITFYNAEDHMQRCRKRVRQTRKEGGRPKVDRYVKRQGSWVLRWSEVLRWFQFKVVPLDKKKYHECKDPWEAIWQRDGFIASKSRVVINYGSEGYRRLYVTDRINLRKVKEKYFLLPDISEKFLLHWPGFKPKDETSDPLNYGIGVERAAETGESISIRICSECECYTSLDPREHLTKCGKYQNTCKTMRKNEVAVIKTGNGSGKLVRVHST